jgi:hypothetical protein
MVVGQVYQDLRRGGKSRSGAEFTFTIKKFTDRGVFFEHPHYPSMSEAIEAREKLVRQGAAER